MTVWWILAVFALKGVWIWRSVSRDTREYYAQNPHELWANAEQPGMNDDA